jgi:hypothetical protein
MRPRTEREARNRARVVEMYRTGSPVREIAETIGYQATSVARIVTRAIPGDERRMLLDQRRRASRKYSLRSDLFQHPLVNDELWLLGLLMADGTINQEKGTLSIGLAITDRDAVALATRVAGSNAPLMVRKPKQGQGYGAHRQPQVWWMLHSQEVVARTMALGLVPRKSWREDVQVPEAIAASPAFWRGIVDGDGRVFWARRPNGARTPRLTVLGARTLLEQWASFVVVQLGEPAPAITHDPRTKTMHYSNLSGSRAWLMVHVLYAKAGPALERKRSIAGEIVASQCPVPRPTPTAQVERALKGLGGLRLREMPRRYTCPQTGVNLGALVYGARAGHRVDLHPLFDRHDPAWRTPTNTKRPKEGS